MFIFHFYNFMLALALSLTCGQTYGVQRALPAINPTSQPTSSAVIIAKPALPPTPTPIPQPTKPEVASIAQSLETAPAIADGDDYEGFEYEEDVEEGNDGEIFEGEGDFEDTELDAEEETIDVTVTEGEIEDEVIEGDELDDEAGTEEVIEADETGLANSTPVPPINPIKQ